MFVGTPLLYPSTWKLIALPRDAASLNSYFRTVFGNPDWCMIGATAPAVAGAP